MAREPAREADEDGRGEETDTRVDGGSFVEIREAEEPARGRRCGLVRGTLEADTLFFRDGGTVAAVGSVRARRGFSASTEILVGVADSFAGGFRTAFP